jgi:hypothetical protein
MGHHIMAGIDDNTSPRMSIALLSLSIMCDMYASMIVSVSPAAITPYTLRAVNGRLTKNSSIYTHDLLSQPVVER